MYIHRQSSGFLLLVLLLPAALCAVVAWTSRHWWLYLAVVALVLVAWAFSSLTIEVNDQELVSYFGPGVWRKRVPLSDIAAATRTASTPFEGWGIRITPRGMLYNVSGLDDVEIGLAGGESFRLGTDEPDRLVAAIEEHMHRPNA